MPTKWNDGNKTPYFMSYTDLILDYVDANISLTKDMLNKIEKEIDKMNTNNAGNAKIEMNMNPSFSKALRELCNSVNTSTPTKNAYSYPICKGIIRRKKTTRVDWADGTKTVIVLEEGKEDLDMFHAFCIAFTKKMLGSTTNILKTIENNDTDKIKADRMKAIEEANRAAAEEASKFLEERNKAAFEEAVKKEMFDHKVREEAIRRLMAKEEKEQLKKEFLEKTMNLPAEEE